jgi:hypothetical protein
VATAQQEGKAKVAVAKASGCMGMGLAAAARGVEVRRVEAKGAEEIEAALAEERAAGAMVMEVVAKALEEMGSEAVEK